LKGKGGALQWIPEEDFQKEGLKSLKQKWPTKRNQTPCFSKNGQPEREGPQLCDTIRYYEGTNAITCIEEGGVFLSIKWKSDLEEKNKAVKRKYVDFFNHLFHGGFFWKEGR